MFHIFIYSHQSHIHNRVLVTLTYIWQSCSKKWWNAKWLSLCVPAWGPLVLQPSTLISKKTAALPLQGLQTSNSRCPHSCYSFPIVNSGWSLNAWALYIPTYPWYKKGPYNTRPHFYGPVLTLTRPLQVLSAVNRGYMSLQCASFHHFK